MADTTGPVEWLLSFRGTRQALMHRGIDVPGHLIVREAALSCGDAGLIATALRGLVEKGLCHATRFAPYLPDPIIAPVLTIYGMNQYTAPPWKFFYQSGPAEPLETGAVELSSEAFMLRHQRRIDSAWHRFSRSPTDRSQRKRDRRYHEWRSALNEWRMKAGVR